MSELTLYNFDLDENCYRVRLLISMLGLEANMVAVDMVPGFEHQKPPVIDLNPLGDIPVLGALFRSTSSDLQKSNLILVLTPYIIREQNDLRVVFERKMQERQEFLDRYFVFNEAQQYRPPHDWSRTNGLIEDIRQGYLGVEEQKALDELTKPKEVKGHEPGQPLELPHGMPTSSSTEGEKGAAPANMNINAPSRSVEKVEK